MAQGQSRRGRWGGSWYIRDEVPVSVSRFDPGQEWRRRAVKFLIARPCYARGSHTSCHPVSLPLPSLPFIVLSIPCPLYTWCHRFVSLLLTFLSFLLLFHVILLETPFLSLPCYLMIYLATYMYYLLSLIFLYFKLIRFTKSVPLLSCMVIVAGSVLIVSGI